MREGCARCEFSGLARKPFCAILNAGVAFIQAFFLLGPGGMVDWELGVRGMCCWRLEKNYLMSHPDKIWRPSID